MRYFNELNSTVIAGEIINISYGITFFQNGQLLEKYKRGHNTYTISDVKYEFKQLYGVIYIKLNGNNTLHNTLNTEIIRLTNLLAEKYGNEFLTQNAPVYKVANNFISIEIEKKEPLKMFVLASTATTHIIDNSSICWVIKNISSLPVNEYINTNNIHSDAAYSIVIDTNKYLTFMNGHKSINLPTMRDTRIYDNPSYCTEIVSISNYYGLIRYYLNLWISQNYPNYFLPDSSENYISQETKIYEVHWDTISNYIVEYDKTQDIKAYIEKKTTESKNKTKRSKAKSSTSVQQPDIIHKPKTGKKSESTLEVGSIVVSDSTSNVVSDSTSNVVSDSTILHDQAKNFVDNELFHKYTKTQYNNKISLAYEWFTIFKKDVADGKITNANLYQPKCYFSGIPIFDECYVLDTGLIHNEKPVCILLHHDFLQYTSYYRTGSSNMLIYRTRCPYGFLDALSLLNIKPVHKELLTSLYLNGITKLTNSTFISGEFTLYAMVASVYYTNNISKFIFEHAANTNGKIGYIEFTK